MDDINGFFSMKEFKRETVSMGYITSRRLPKIEPNQVVKRERDSVCNAEEDRNAELDELEKPDEFFETPAKRFKEGESDGDGASTTTSDIPNDVYDRYDFNRKLPDLPIAEMRELILKAIQANRVVILEGATGCGKSTQVPQFILDEGYETRRRVNIIVAQPRRIAAISIANRVARERGLSELPNVIGYQIGLNVKVNEDTRITFCTTGVLLEKLVGCKTLEGYTHIILDEVHERSQDMDFLFIIIKQLRQAAPRVRIILMSATIEASEDTTSLSFELDNPEIKEEMYLLALQLIYVFDRIDNTDDTNMKTRPSILIFLPGYYEIGCMNKYIVESANVLHQEPIIVILHSKLTHEEQVKAMKIPPPGRRKIILATNIAESSITVPDVKYVIDFCLTKHNVVDTTTNITSLQLQWCSRSNARQRAGRTGRTMDGRVYRLVPKDFYENKMDECSRPEMCRCTLEKVVLKAKQLNMGPPLNVLKLAMDPPSRMDVENTILLLKEAGAMLRTVYGRHSDEDGDITLMGHVMTSLPVDFLVAKLIVLGYCYNVLSECIIIGAGLTTKSIFQQGIKNVVRFYSKKVVWSDGSGSDLIAILKAYQAYSDRVRNQSDVKKWADRHYLNEKSLSEMTDLIKDITERLQRFGIKEYADVNKTEWSAAEKLMILKVVIAGAFYPNYFVQSPIESTNRDRYREMNGLDPCNIVILKGFTKKFVRPLYVESIKKLLSPCTNVMENMQVTFDEGGERVYVSFRQTQASINANTEPELGVVQMGPGQVCVEVYKAVKLRKSGKPLELRVMHQREAEKYAVRMKVGSLVGGDLEFRKKTIENIQMLCLPRKSVKSVTGKITHYDPNFNRFWLRPDEEERYFREIQSELNSSKDIEEFSRHEDIQIGQVVAALYDGVYNRAKVLSTLAVTDNVYYNVMLLDIGVEVAVEFSELRRLRGVSAKYLDIPPRVFECRLASIEPSELHSDRYEWQSVMTQLKILTSDSTVCAKIYSVFNGAASVFISLDDRTVQDILIDEGFARASDEDFMSKQDHDRRLKRQEQRGYYIEEDCEMVEQEMRYMMPVEEPCEVEEPDVSTRNITVTLSGPKSQLELDMYTCLHQGKSKSAAIDTHSVNSIFLQSNPQDSFQKYVVAANVTENQKRDLTARETTVMPSIPGFGPLMALLFSPHCEFFSDKYRSRYTAILCGLGQHPVKKHPIYSEHDAALQLDVEIDVTDIERINRMRIITDTFLQTIPDQKRPLAAECDRIALSSQLKTEVFELLERQRPLTGIASSAAIGWARFDPNDLIEVKEVFPSTAIFPPHSILSLAAADSPGRLCYNYDLIQNNEELHRKSKSDVPLIRAAKCLLCHTEMDNVADIRIHLHSRLHREREHRVSLGH